MARFLAYTSPARGHLYPIVPALLELHQRGHDVHVRTLASEVEALRAVGLHAEPLAPAIEELHLDDWRWSTPEEALSGGMRTFGERSVHEVADLQETIPEIDPDALIIDITTAGATAVADAGALPWAQWIPFFEHYRPDPASAPVVGYIPFSLHPEGLEALNRPRRLLGLPTFDESASEALWRADRYLYLTAAPFDTEGLELPSKFRTIGPGIWEPSRELPEWTDDLKAPVVLVAVSSEFQRDDALITVALEAFEGEDVQVIATTAAHDPQEFKIPSNARVERWLPHLPILERAACVVCHGGMGITQKSLSAGVPVCVVPFGRDQFEVAGRVAAVGAGTHVIPDELTPETLRAAVRNAMGMRAGAQRVADAFARTGGASAAADELEGLLQGVPNKEGTTATV